MNSDELVVSISLAEWSELPLRADIRGIRIDKLISEQGMNANKPYKCQVSYVHKKVFITGTAKEKKLDE
jgi:hypothetical protein